MPYTELEISLKSALKNRTDEDDFDSISFLIYEFQTRFDFDYNDISFILFKCPTILKKNSMSIINNLNELANNLNLKDVELKYLILKIPNLLIMQEQIIKYKLNLVSTIFGCSVKSSIKLIYEYPELLFISKAGVVKKISEICDVFNEYGLKVRAILRKEPQLLFCENLIIEQIKKILMKSYTLSEEESNNVLTQSPEMIIEGVEKVIEKFNFYYPKYFIKRDLKEILSNCPKFLSLSCDCFLNKMDSIKKVFSIEEKKACDFIRIEPNILFFDSIEKKLKEFIKYNINLKYVFSAPKLCLAPEISLPIKFILARILSLESEFNKICSIDSNLFVSRFLFMQSYGYYDHYDLLLNEQEFYNKYNISSKLLKLNYKLDYDSLTNLCAYYINSRDKMKHWSDMIFPSWEDILDYFNCNFNKRSFVEQRYLILRDANLITKRQFSLFNELKKLQLTDDEIKFILNKNKGLNKFYAIEIKNIIYLLKKFGFTQEQIIKMLMEKTYLFDYSMRDFNILLNEVCENEKCDEIVAIEKYM